MTLFAPEPSAVFVDRDGVICENRSDHVKDWSEFVFIPGSIEAMSSLRRAGLRLFVITNQAIVGRGLLSRRSLDVMHERMLDALGASGAKVEAVLVCPHVPEDRCTCRKPEAGLLLTAAGEYKVDLAASFMVGDHVTDVEAGARAGCQTVLVKTGRGTAALRGGQLVTPPDFVADDLVDAAIWILSRRALASGRRPKLRLAGAEGTGR